MGLKIDEGVLSAIPGTHKGQTGFSGDQVFFGDFSGQCLCGACSDANPLYALCQSLVLQSSDSEGSDSAFTQSAYPFSSGRREVNARPI
jgi:hypothetical protein